MNLERTMWNRPSFSMVLLAVLLACWGCNQATGPATFPVTGKVTYKGEPLSGATVSFIADGSGKSCDGVTDDGGVYRLQTYLADGKQIEGAQVGVYRITVIKLDDANATMEAPPKNLLPGKYAKTKTSALTAEVKGNGPEEFNFELK